MEDLNSFTPPASTPELPPMPNHMVPKKGVKPVAVALIVAAVFLLGSIGAALWMIYRPAGSYSIAAQVTGDGSDKVKSLTFVAPTGISSTYVTRSQNTHTAQTTYYTDGAAGCTITTMFQSLPADTTPKDLTIATAEAAKSYGITTTSNADTNGITIKDADGGSYDFKAVQLEQTIDVPGVAFKAQRNFIAYKQFGSSVASIGYACQTGNWDTKKGELNSLVATFTVKTEK